MPRTIMIHQEARRRRHSLSSWISDKMNVSKKNQKQCKRVRFESSPEALCEVHEIAPLFEYSTILWWSKVELRHHSLTSTVKNIAALSDEKLEIMKNYMRTYYKSRNQINKGTKVCPALLRDLINAKAEGHDDMERYCLALTMDRQKKIRLTVASIISAYKSEHLLSSNEERDKHLRHHATKMSKHDREWAAVIAKADAEVATAIYDDGVKIHRRSKKSMRILQKQIHPTSCTF